MFTAIRALMLLLPVLTTAASAYNVTTAVVFPISGNVYPDGYYTVNLNISNPPKEYTLAIDTGTDLTWLQCGIDGANTTRTPHDLYKLRVTSLANGTINATLIASCMHFRCVDLQQNGVPNCGERDTNCYYQTQYADAAEGLSQGLLVFDNVNLPLTNGTMLKPLVAIGCGYNQEFNHRTPPFVDGILGLGKGKAGFLTQLRSFGILGNIIAHCFGSQGKGYLAFGGDTSQFSNIYGLDDIYWVPALDDFIVGSAELYFGGVKVNTTNIHVAFDSGSTYTYFSSVAYGFFFSKLNISKELKIANDDHTLPVCWKGAQPFTSISDAVAYNFESFGLSIRGVTFVMDLKSYLIVSEQGNFCLGILNGGMVGLGDELITIGGISMQDTWMIFDNENSRVGWVTSQCSVEPPFNASY